MAFSDIEKERHDVLRSKLNDLLVKMDRTQIGRLLTVSVARSIIFFNRSYFRVFDSKKYSHYLNSLIISLGVNCILLFNEYDRDLDLFSDRVRNRIRNLAHDRDLYLDRVRNRAYALIRDRDRNLDLDRDLDLIRVRNIDRVINWGLDSALDCVRDSVLYRNLVRIHNLDFVRDIVRDLDSVLENTQIMIADAETILFGRKSFLDNTKSLKNHEDAFFEFTTTLRRDLNGKYWAEWFERLFYNNFRLVQKDAEAILQLLKKFGIYNSIEKSSAFLLEYMKGAADSDEIRLMILGDKGEGKTSFAWRFQKLDADMPKGDESTEGIDIHAHMRDDISKKITTKELYPNAKRDVAINIWDFAGHEITHAAHKFFLSKDRCVYVIVCQTRRDENVLNSKIEYWLEHIRIHARGTRGAKAKERVCILINEWDDRKPNIGEKLLKKNYKEEYELSFHYLNIDRDNQEGGKLDAFRQELVDFIVSTDTKVPESIKRMQERINSKFKELNYIKKDEIISIINKESEGDWKSILRILDTCAYCFWFEDIPGINTVVLNPRWITGAVYKIINCVKSTPYKNATIRKSDFDLALREKDTDRPLFPKDQDNFIFEAMTYFELAYSKDDATLVIPHCLNDSYPDDETGIEFDPKDCVQIDFCIPTLAGVPSPKFPEETIPLFIVKNSDSIHKNVKGKSMICRDRAMFSIPERNTKAEIWRFSYETQRICITVKGNDFDNNVKYLSELVDCLLNKILFTIDRFRVQKPEIHYLATGVNHKQILLSIKHIERMGVKEAAKLEDVELSKEECDKATKTAGVIGSIFYISFNNCNFTGDVETMKNQVVSDSQNSNIINAEGGSTITTVNIVCNNIDVNELNESIEEIRKHIGELTADMQNEINDLLETLKEEVTKGKPKIGLLKSIGNSLSDMANAIPAGVLSSAIYDLVKKFF